MKVTVKNLAKSNQFVNTAGGAKTLTPGSSGEAEFSDGEFESMKKNPFLELTVDGEVVSKGDVPPEGEPATAAEQVVWGEGRNEAGQEIPTEKPETKKSDAGKKSEK